jgi:hypothetical protein
MNNKDSPGLNVLKRLRRPSAARGVYPPGNDKGLCLDQPSLSRTLWRSRSQSDIA